jgi:hypothetical protein
MATTTPNFGWPVPTSSDLVKNGATAIEGLGDAIDASLLDLKGGTTGQVLAKASNTDMDFSWVVQDDANAIQNTQLTAKGALISAVSAGTPATLTVGTNNQVLTADSTTATGLKWATPAAGGSGLTLITSSSFSAVTSHSINNCFTSTYANYFIQCTFTGGSSTTSKDLTIKLRASGTDTSTGYTDNNFTQTGTYTAGEANKAGTDEMYVGTFQGDKADANATQFYLYAPQLTQTTLMTGHFVYDDQYNAGQRLIQGKLANSTSYDGLTLIVSGNNMTGTIRVYGLQNS